MVARRLLQGFAGSFARPQASASARTTGKAGNDGVPLLPPCLPVCAVLWRVRGSSEHPRADAGMVLAGASPANEAPVDAQQQQPPQQPKPPTPSGLNTAGVLGALAASEEGRSARAVRPRPPLLGARGGAAAGEIGELRAAAPGPGGARRLGGLPHAAADDGTGRGGSGGGGGADVVFALELQKRRQLRSYAVARHQAGFRRAAEPWLARKREQDLRSRSDVARMVREGSASRQLLIPALAPPRRHAHVAHSTHMHRVGGRARTGVSWPSGCVGPVHGVYGCGGR
eukprot:COSAG01_NODE_2755_length_7137_cov_3.530548_7_plen_285_part_00